MPTGIYKRQSRGREQQETINRKFNRLLVLNYNVEISKQKGYDCYLCKCNCGTEKIIRGSDLRQKLTQSCGCLRREKPLGENHPNYIHGFKSKATEKFHESIRKRDNYTCQKCSKTQTEELKTDNKKLSVHHINGNHYDDRPKNCITYCNSCHQSIERKFKAKIKN